jgi:hypothetical protein
MTAMMNIQQIPSHAFGAISLVRWDIKFWHHLPSTAASIDILLGTILLAVVPFAMAAYGGHVAAESIADLKKRRDVKRTFWGICIVGIALAFVQQSRSIIEDSDSKTKTGQVEGAILGWLQNLHLQAGPTTSAEIETRRREGIMSMLRAQYVLQHNSVPGGILEGTTPLPSEWVNSELKQLGENWTVFNDQPQPSATKIASRSYLAYEGNPRFTGSVGYKPGDPILEGKDFQVGDPIGFNLSVKATGPEAVQVYARSTMLIMEPDVSPKSQEDAVEQFQKQIELDRKRILVENPAALKSPSTMVPGDAGFSTAMVLTDPPGMMTRATSNELDKLRAGAEIAFITSTVPYKDRGVMHHLRRCIYLEPPAQAPGIWHFCDRYNDSD